jgi:hypothetical protein
MPKSVLRIGAIEHSGRTLTIEHSCEGPVGEFVARTPFQLRADHPLDSIPPGILVIPLLGIFVPLSWIIDCQIIAGDTDEAYLQSLAEVRSEMKKAYPALEFHGSIDARAVRTNSGWDPDKYCLLYSGGVDSTSSYIRNRDKNPALVMIRGTPDVRLSEKEYWQRTADRLVPALRKAKAELHTVETNALDIVDSRALKDSVHNEEIHGWWENFAHGIFLVSSCAPFTSYSHSGKLLIASSYSPQSAKPWGSMPESDERIRWGGLAVKHDSFDITRYQKIHDYLAPFVQSQGGAWPLKLCLGKEDRLKCGKLNCGRCDKCLTTAITLLENGVDPARCDFDMSRFSPGRIRMGLENGYIHMDQAPFSWRYIIENAGPVRPDIEAEYKGMNDFLRWIPTWDKNPRESTLRSYSRKVAPVDSRRRRVAKRILRKT